MSGGVIWFKNQLQGTLPVWHPRILLIFQKDNDDTHVHEGSAGRGIRDALKATPQPSIRRNLGGPVNSLFQLFCWLFLIRPLLSARPTNNPGLFCPYLFALFSINGGLPVLVPELDSSSFFTVRTKQLLRIYGPSSKPAFHLFSSQGTKNAHLHVARWMDGWRRSVDLRIESFYRDAVESRSPHRKEGGQPSVSSTHGRASSLGRQSVRFARRWEPAYGGDQQNTPAGPKTPITIH
jgi:hypothetical protein